jgi:hypothetical protein
VVPDRVPSPGRYRLGCSIEEESQRALRRVREREKMKMWFAEREDL